MEQKQQYTQKELCEFLNIKPSTLSHFKKIQKQLEKQKLKISKVGIGTKAIYIIEPIITSVDIIKINGIEYPEIPIGQAKNLKNKTFSRLTPLFRTNDYLMSSGRKDTQWICQCKCGNKIPVRASALISKNTRSCGCLQKEHNWHGSNFKDLTNQRFGKLVVKKYLETNKRGTRWLCQCDCGNFKEVQSAELYNGDTTSCGCRYKTSYGEETIEKILNQNNIHYKKEYSFKDLKGKNEMFPLRFDFAIFDKEDNLSYLIEYDGEQHFKEIDSQIWGSNTTLKERQSYDQKKNEYCLKNNIKLYRIPYWKKQQISLELLTNNNYLVTTIKWQPPKN